MSLYLVIDTAFETCQIGLFENDACIAEKRQISGGRHDHVLATMAEGLFVETKTSLSDIDKIIVTTGPGRFTGLRVGIAFARGLALVHKTPMTGVLTTDALERDFKQAYASEKNSAIIVCVKKGESFVRLPPDEIIRVVSDDHLSEFLKAHHITRVCGVLSAAAEEAVASAQINPTPDLTEPSLASIAVLGGENPISEVVRPYYAA